MPDVATRRMPRVPQLEWLKALPPAMRLAFHGGAAARAALEPVWGPGFSDEPCRARILDARATLWLGPDEYLLLDRMNVDATPAPTLERLELALVDIPHSLVDVSHRQLTLDISGPHAETILRGACPLDLDIGEFPVGMCTRTVLAKADILLWRTAPMGFHLDVWRSFAGYVTGLLGDIATEFYPAP